MSKGDQSVLYIYKKYMRENLMKCAVCVTSSELWFFAAWKWVSDIDRAYSAVLIFSQRHRTKVL